MRRVILSMGHHQGLVFAGAAEDAEDIAGIILLRAQSEQFPPGSYIRLAEDVLQVFLQGVLADS